MELKGGGYTLGHLVSNGTHEKKIQIGRLLLSHLLNANQ
jgi:hypothetical protein